MERKTATWTILGILVLILVIVSIYGMIGTADPDTPGGSNASGGRDQGIH